jgi:hypothetical protein
MLKRPLYIFLQGYEFCTQTPSSQWNNNLKEEEVGKNQIKRMNL